MNKFARLGIQVVLVLLVIFTAYKLYSSIMQPVSYEKVKDVRKEVIIERLQQIRDIQIEYRKIHGSYTSDFDTLKTFFNEGLMPVVFKEGSNDTLTEERAIELNLIKIDTTYVLYKDTMFTEVEGFDIAKINIVPFTNGKVEFNMAADTIKRPTFDVFVFEVKTYMKDYLSDIKNAELRDNEILERIKKDLFEGLKIGSMTEPSTTGNWE